MKNNRKNRALKYIREKNKVRSYKLLTECIKVSDTFNDSEISNLIIEIKQSVINKYSKFNYNVGFNLIKAGIDEGDVLNNTFTIKLTHSRVN